MARLDNTNAYAKRFEVGTKWRIKYGDKHPFNKVIHIRAVIDGSHIVFAFWSRRRQTWIYEVEWFYWFYVRRDVLEFIGPSQLGKPE